jgi:hypothetical protein
VHELDVELKNSDTRSIHYCKTINTTQLRNLCIF